MGWDGGCRDPLASPPRGRAPWSVAYCSRSPPLSRARMIKTLPSPQDDLEAFAFVLGESGTQTLLDQCMDALEVREHRVSEDLVLFRAPKYPTCNIGPDVTKGWMRMLSLQQMALALRSLLEEIQKVGRQPRLRWILSKTESPQAAKGRGRGLGWADLPYGVRTHATGRYSKAKAKALGARWRRRRSHRDLSFFRSKTECPSHGEDPKSKDPS